MSASCPQTEGMVTKLKNQLAAQEGQLQSTPTQLTPLDVSPVEIHPINSSADEEGGTTVLGCDQNDASIRKEMQKRAIKCRLWHLKKTTIIAEGTVYKSDGKIMLHNKALPKDCYKVSIDKSLVDAAFIPDVGSNGCTTVLDAVGGFVAWPKNQVVFDPKRKDRTYLDNRNGKTSNNYDVQEEEEQHEEGQSDLQSNLTYVTEREKHNKAKLEIRGYEIALESLEARILGHFGDKKNELAWGERYEFQNYDLKCREIKINNLNLELEKVVKERDELKLKIEKWEGSSKNLTKILNSQMSTHDKNGLGFGTQMDDLSNKSETDSENSLTVFEVRSSDEESTLANNRFTKANEYHVVPPPIIGNPLTLRADISFAGLDEYAFRNKIIESKTTETNKTVGNTNEATIVKPKSVNETVVSKSKINRNEVIIEDWTSDDEDDVCAVKTVSSVKPNVTQAVRSQADLKCTDHLIKDCDFYKSPEPRVKNMVNTGERVVKPVWGLWLKGKTPKPFSNKFENTLHAKRTFNPSAVLTRAGLVNTDRSNVSTARAVVSKGKVENVLKKAKWGNPEILLQDHAVVDSGCSSHITGNKAYLSDYEDFNEGFVAFGSDPKGDKTYFKLLDESQVVLRAPIKDDVYSLNLKNIVPSGGLEKQLNHNVKIIRCDNGTEFKNYVMNEFCAKKGIKREFSVARTPQQNGVAERKNRTLIEAARTMLADSLLPIPFWTEAVNTACYVLNRVLVTKPQNKTPYELLIGKSPSISFMRPFGCPLTILNTLDSLGKFDGKSDEGYLLGYSTSSKAFRVYNKRTKRVEENLHINFLEDQPNVAGTGPNWMFDLDFLTNSMNYIPVSVENQVIMDAGTQDSYVAGSSGKDKGPTQEYILLPLQPHRIRFLVKDVVQDAQAQTSENASPDKDIQDSEDVFDKEGQHQMPEDEQVWQDELEMMVTQELVANAMNDESRQAFEEEKRRIASQKKAAQATSTNQLSTDRPFVSTDRSFVSTDRSNTPNVSAASTSTGANADESSFVYLGGKIPIDASTLPNADLPIDPNMPDLEDASDTLPNDGIFNGAYDDDEDVGAVADFNNMDNTIAVSPIPTLRIHKDHLKGQILGDPTSAVQTRGKIQKASSAQQALFKLQQVWILVDLPFGKKAIGTKWVFRNKRDERSIVVKNKARLVAQGHRQEEGIDYDEVFAPVARIEAIRLFLDLIPLLDFPCGFKSSFMVYIQAPRSFYETLSYFLLEKVLDEMLCTKRFRWFHGRAYIFWDYRVKQQPDGILPLAKTRIPFLKLEAFSDSDYAGASLDRKSTTGGCQFLGRRLISWQCTIMANSTAEAEYIIASHCCGQNLVYHLRTKHNEIRHHFIRDCYEKRLIDVLKIHTDSNVADLLTKGSYKTFSPKDLMISMDLRMDRCSPGKYYSSMVWDIVPLLPAMLAGAVVDQGEGSAQPAEPHHTPVDPISHPHPNHLFHHHLIHHSPPHSPLYSPPHSPHQSPPFSPPRSYEAPLPEGNTSRSAEDSMQLKELMVLVPTLITRINSLEKELKDTKQTLGDDVVKLVKNVKSLEIALKRKSKKVIVSESKSEEPEDQGRIIQDIDDDPLGGSEEVNQSSNLGGQLKSLSIKINTGIKDVNIGSTKVDSGTASKRGQREGNAPMIEEDIQATYKTKEQMRQRKLDWERLYKIEANAELTKDVLGKDLPEQILQKGVGMAEYEYGIWKLFSVKGSEVCEEIKEEFDRLVQQIDTFVPMDFEATKAKLKRYGEELQDKDFKKQRFDDKRLEDAYDRVLLSDLKTMFDPPLSEDAIWSLPLQLKMVSWSIKLSKKLPSDAENEASRWKNE
ncbi:ribonuclease H-like domain-containing protein [Tanacetum coccineum]|uniref:Ribonuclease H-like domain-containing protein n=1 Tax=Tanacetum coccineum TaxID=301880 RepID=A0ABQ4YM23_9ASTR